jgi:mannose-6-phosphate isomerase
MAVDDEIEKAFRESILEDVRPWGKFRSYPYDLGSTVKIITIDPGQALSLQYHHRRAEFWVILDRGLEVTVGERVSRPDAGEELYIPREAVHRVRCVGAAPARIMEIWIGDPDESDIVRVEDKYHRIK